MPTAAAAAGAGGINDDNREAIVKGEVGEPSKSQVIGKQICNGCMRPFTVLAPFIETLTLQ